MLQNVPITVTLDMCWGLCVFLGAEEREVHVRSMGSTSTAMALLSHLLRHLISAHDYALPRRRMGCRPRRQANDSGGDPIIYISRGCRARASEFREPGCRISCWDQPLFVRLLQLPVLFLRPVCCFTPRSRHAGWTLGFPVVETALFFLWLPSLFG